MKRHFNIEVSGRVQGVCYRFEAKKEAIKLNLKGYVKNCTDGSVYIEAEGEDYQLEIFANWCRTGPEYSDVKEVVINEGELKNYKFFDIKI
jgi:acylphosphatase